MRLIVQTAEKVLLDEQDLGRIRLPMADGGSIGVRPGHHPLIGEIGAGRLQYGHEAFEEETAVESGIVQIDQDVITIFTSGWLNTEVQEGASAEEISLDRLSGLLKQYGQQA